MRGVEVNRVSGQNIVCQVTRATDQVIPNNVLTIMSFSSEIVDLGGFWVVGSPTRLTIPTTGYYRAWFSALFAPSAVGVRIWGIRKNGTDDLASELMPVGHATLGIQGMAYIEDSFTAGDFLEATVYHEAGGALSVLNAPYSPLFGIRKLDRAG